MDYHGFLRSGDTPLDHDGAPTRTRTGAGKGEAAEGKAAKPAQGPKGLRAAAAKRLARVAAALEKWAR